MNKKIFIGCLGSLIILALILYFSISYLKNNAASFVLYASKKTINMTIENSYMSEDQKKSFQNANEKIFEAISSGEIEFDDDGRIVDRGKAVSIISPITKDCVNGLNIDAEQKLGVNRQIDRLAHAYTENKINENQIVNMFRELYDRGDLGIMFIFWYVEVSYILPSGLDDGEKVKAKKTLGRLAGAFKNRKVSRAELEELFTHLGIVDEEGKRQWKSVEDEELRTLLQDTEKLLDKKGASPTPLKFDIAGEIEQVLDDAGLPK